MKPDRSKPVNLKRTDAGQASGRPASVGAGNPRNISAQDREPIAGLEHTPMWLIVLLGVLFYGVQLYLDRYAGGFNVKVHEPYVSYQELEDMRPKSGDEMILAKGMANYMTLCAPCHQASGLGNPGQAPPLVGSEWVVGSPERVIRIPIQGLTGPIQVNGQEWNATMPPMVASTVSDEDFAALLTYIRRTWGNQASAVTKEQVKAVRDAVANRSDPWTADELSKLP
jgi:mono/diheme cytochrome c family protein